MEYTGERPTIEYGLVSSRMRYKLLVPHIQDKKIIDVGCGVGHGTYALSHYAKSAVGFDPDVSSIHVARRRFLRPNLRFISELDWQQELIELDIIASVECVEHLEKPALESMLELFAKNTPSFVATTPNGNLFPYHPNTLSERRGFHTWHYTYDELVKLFSRFYAYVDIAGHAFDPKLQSYTGFTIFATNKFVGWSEEDFVIKPKIPPEVNRGTSHLPNPPQFPLTTQE